MGMITMMVQAKESSCVWGAEIESDRGGVVVKQW